MMLDVTKYALFEITPVSMLILMDHSEETSNAACSRLNSRRSGSDSTAKSPTSFSVKKSVLPHFTSDITLTPSQTAGGITINATVPLTRIDEKTIRGVLQAYKVRERVGERFSAGELIIACSSTMPTS